MPDHSMLLLCPDPERAELYRHRLGAAAALAVAEDDDAALAYLLREEVQLCLVDGRRRYRHCQDFLRRLRTHPATADLAVLIVGLDPGDPQRALLLRAGADDVLADSLPGDEFHARVAAQARRQERISAQRRLDLELRCLLDQIEPALLLIDQSGRIVASTRSARRLLLLNDDLLRLIGLEQILRTLGLDDPTRQRLQRSREAVGPLLCSLGDRSSSLRIRMQPLHDAQASGYRVLSVEPDAESSLTPWLAAAVHDLRNAHYVMRGYLGLLDDRSLPPLRAREFALGMAERLEQARSLVDDLLTLTRNEAQLISAQPQTLSWVSWLRKLIAEHRPMARRLGSEIVLEIEKSMLDCRVEADPLRMRQVLDNLLINALRHGPPAATIRVRVTEQSDGQLLLAIADGGPGPDPQRLSETLRANRGLGLWIASSLLARMGASLCAVEISPQVRAIGCRLPASMWQRAGQAVLA